MQKIEAWVIVVGVGLQACCHARVYSDTFLLRTRSTEARIANCFQDWTVSHRHIATYKVTGEPTQQA